MVGSMVAPPIAVWKPSATIPKNSSNLDHEHFFFLRHFSELSSHETECTPRSIYYERGTTACLRAGHLLFSSQSKQVKGMCLTLSLPSAGQVSIMGR